MTSRMRVGAYNSPEQKDSRGGVEGLLDGKPEISLPGTARTPES